MNTQPMIEAEVNFSPINMNEENAAKTGSIEKINATLVGVV